MAEVSSPSSSPSSAPGHLFPRAHPPSSSSPTHPRCARQISRTPSFRLDDIHDLSKDAIRERTMEKVSSIISPRRAPRDHPLPVVHTVADLPLIRPSVWCWLRL